MLAIFASFCVCGVFTQAHEEKSFLSWMRKTNNIFTGDEYRLRLGVWLANARFVQEHNSASSFEVDMNHLSALTPAEYRAMLGFKAVSLNTKPAVYVKRVGDAGLDWREKGAVTDIKDQGQCGSCWAFSTISSTESSNYCATGKLIALSEANLVDCVTTCHGCSGGLMTSAFDYVIKYQKGKFMLESDYQYKPAQTTCQFDAKKAVAHVEMYINIQSGDEENLAGHCGWHGPVSVAIDAGHTSFQLYKSGIYSEEKCSAKNLDHAVVCVGYGSEGESMYWIVRNSWGVSWGEKGYIRMIWKDNQCGIATMACVPVP